MSKRRHRLQRGHGRCPRLPQGAAPDRRGHHRQACTGRQLFDRFEIAGPGFINLFLAQDWFTSVVRAAVANPENGRTDVGAGKRYNVEFVSANPTGPMHMGNARGGAPG